MLKLALLLLVVAAPKTVPSLLDWGAAVELPVVGPLLSVPSGNSASSGALLGLGGSYDLFKGPFLHLGVSHMRTYDGRLTVRYASGTQTPQRVLVAAWQANLVALGGGWAWHDVSPWLTPYVGGDVLLGWGGYTTVYDSDAQAILASPPHQSILAPPESHEAFTYLWGLGLRGGARLHWRSWLSSAVEIGLCWVPFPATGVSNSREIRDVRVAEHAAFFLHYAFLLRAAL